MWCDWPHTFTIHIPSPKNAVHSEIKTINIVSDHMILIYLSIYFFLFNVISLKLIECRIVQMEMPFN